MRKRERRWEIKVESPQMRASTSQTFVPLRTDSKLQVAFSPDSLEVFHQTNIMRSNTLRNAARTLSGGLKEALIPQSSRAPYICASCCTTSSPRAIRQPFAPTIASRAFSAISSQKQDPSTQPTAQETALPQTYYDLFPNTFPSGPPPKAPFTPDLKQLRKEFIQLQGLAHPDRAGADKQRQAEALSARINEAYKTLQDPLRRARYLLAQHGIDVEDESAQISDNALLMEVMEAREAVEEVEDEEGLVSIREENDVRIGESVKVLEACFEKGDLEAAAQEAIRLRYWSNIAESIHGWEKGVGGGLNHH
jgi:molecular chaperone HscB